MAKHLYDSLNSPSTTIKPSAPTLSRILEGTCPSADDDALPLQPALSSTILQHNTTDKLPSTSLPTNRNAVLPRALQAQLSSLMTQFLQFDATPANTMLEATQITGNLSSASATHAPNQPPSSIATATMSHPTIITPTPGHTAITQPLQLTIPATVQPLINVVQPPSTPAASGTIVPPAYLYTKHVQPLIHQMASDTLPPVPAQMRQKVIQDWTLQAIGSECSRPTRFHPCMAHPVLYTLLVQYQTLGVAPTTRQTYQAGVRSYLQCCNQFNIVAFPASSLTLRYFCAHIACQVSHKTIKVYLSGVRLEHLEHGLPGPTDDELLRLLCKGIKRSQGDISRLQLPITINILKL